ncbi:MAG TPA: hypothetical protein VF647_22905 [Longimicrobium sp.]|jgi:hypothetical protein
MAEKKMTPKDAARIQSAEAKRGGGKVQSGTFAARAQRAGAKGATKSSKLGGAKGTRT